MVNLPSKSEGGLEVNPAYVEQRIQEAMETGEADEYEVGYHRLELKRVLGKGAFGKVFLAEAYGLGESQDTTTLVAVKVLNGEFPSLLLCFGLACERRRISVVSSLRLKSIICEPEPLNDFFDVKPFVLRLTNQIKE